MVIPAVGCARRTPPPVAAGDPPQQTARPVDTSAADRARQDSIAAAELARRQAAEREARARTARAQEVLTTVVYFELDSDQLSAETQDRLRTKAAIMRANPSVELRIEGHADERGSTEYNIALGQRRAESVRTFLAGYGITANRLTTISYGKERPSMEGSNETAWARNRRAEFALISGEITAVPPEVP
jgi:peptidoglycan-associated lipoprotein